MNNPPSWTAREESLLLLNAYLDHELDAAAVLDVERRISADATLKAEYDRLLQLRTALASHLTKERASESLRHRVAAIAAPLRPVTARRPRPPRSYDWRQMAAAAVIAAVLASGGTYLSLREATPANELAAIVAGHQRALLARHSPQAALAQALAVQPRIRPLTQTTYRMRVTALSARIRALTALQWG
jgi:anti-sigma factor RsiW